MKPKKTGQKPIVIFGAGEIARLALFYFNAAGGPSVAAFTVDDRYRKSEAFCGLKLVALSELAAKFPPRRFDAFVAVGYDRMNAVREEKYKHLKKLGYRLVSYLSPRCTCLTADIGDNCFILEDNTIQPFVKIGNNVTLWSGNHIGHGSQIGDHTFVTSHVVVSGGVTVGEGAFIGVNATLRDRIRIGARAMIGAGALITKDVGEAEIYRAQPARRSDLRSGDLKKI